MTSSIQNFDTYTKYIAPTGYKFVQPLKNNNCFSYLTGCSAVQSLTQSISHKYENLPLRWITAGVYEACKNHNIVQERMDTFCTHKVNFYDNTKLTLAHTNKANEILNKLSAFQQASENEQLQMIAPFAKIEQDKIKQEAKAKKDEILAQKAKLEEELSRVNSLLK